LNERRGLSVSTLTTRRQPSNALRVSASYCGVLRKTGSITPAACAMLASERRRSLVIGAFLPALARATESFGPLVYLG
jgi:hypothetical protein